LHINPIKNFLDDNVQIDDFSSNEIFKKVDLFLNEKESELHVNDLDEAY